MHDLSNASRTQPAYSSLRSSEGGVTAYVFLNKDPRRDLTSVGSGIFGFGLFFTLYQIVALGARAFNVPFLRLPWNELLGCSIGAGLATFYLAYHTSLIVGGKHRKYRMDADDHVYGAMALFSDIINLFIYILRILAEVSVCVCVCFCV